MRRTNVTEQFQVRPKIDTLPFVGVMLLVVIAFVATPPLIGYGPVLPRARTTELVLPNGILLGIDREGKFYLHGDGAFDLIPPPRLSARLAEAYAGRPDDRVLYLAADEDAAYAHVLTAIDAARGAGVDRFEILADAPRERRYVR